MSLEDFIVENFWFEAKRIWRRLFKHSGQILNIMQDDNEQKMSWAWNFGSF